MNLAHRDKGHTKYTFRVTCVEIYNDVVRDLFQQDSHSLLVRWSAEEGFYLENVTIVESRSLQDFLQIFSLAAKNRVVGAHQMNDRSNRSHCIVTVHVDSKTQGEAATYGKLTIVDLAGSERAKDTDTSGHQLNEAGHINKSLYALKKVGFFMSC